MLVESLGIGLLSISVVVGFFIAIGSKKGNDGPYYGHTVRRRHRCRP